MSNNEMDIDEFLKECTECNKMTSEDKKYEKAINLIENIPNKEYVQDKYKIFYYGNISSLYYYVANIKCKKYSLLDGKQFIADNILDDKNSEHLNEIFNDEINAFEYGKIGVNIELLPNTLEIMSKEDRLNKKEIAKIIMQQYEVNKENFRKISQELAILYYIANDEDKFIFYGDYAVEYESLNAINLFLKYYCDKMDFDNAEYYFEKIHNYPVSGFYGSVENNLALKMDGYKIYWDFFYNLGNYEDSKKIAEIYREFALKNRLDDEILLYVEKHIKDCEQKIQELNNYTYKEDELFKYFDKDIVNLMNNENKIYILTSLNIYDYMKSKENEITMDFSATLMPILKAVENIIFDIVGVNYHEFILRKKEIDINMVKPFVNEKYKTIRKKFLD